MNHKGLIVLFLLCGYSLFASAQIIAPDTVCVGSSVNFTTNNTGVTYSWFMGDVDITPTAPSPLTLIASGSPMATPSFTSIREDNGVWYTFTDNYGTGNLIKMNHGSDPSNTPTMTDLGNFGISGGEAGGLDIVRDDVSGNWYGFEIDGTQMLRLSFGNSLNNIPTGTLMSFPLNIAWGHEFRVKKIGTQWVGFLANRSAGMSRFDFGTSLANTPTAVNLPTTNTSSPVSFSIVNDNGNWYMMVANLSPASIARFDLGTNIQNNTPASVNLGNFGGQLNLTRLVYMVKDCNQIFGYVLNEFGNLFKLDLNNNITNPAPILTNLSTFGNNNFSMYMYNNTLRCYSLNANTNTYSTATFQSYTTAPVFTNYGTQNQSYTFTTPGTYNINLVIDQGFNLYPQAYCKQIVVVNSLSANLGPDTTLCAPSYTINANVPGAQSYIWNTGATTPSITVNQSGNYWVTLNNGSCSIADTMHVTLNALPNFHAMPHDTTVCPNTAFSLNATGADNYYWTPATYLSNAGIANPVVTPAQSTTYLVTGHNELGCTGLDSVRVTVEPYPTILLSPKNPKLCGGGTVQLSEAGVNNPQWSPAATLSSASIANPVATPTETTTYTVTGTSSIGCPATDSVTISLYPVPVIRALADQDTINCTEPDVQLYATGGVSYYWTPFIILNSPSIYNPIAKINETTTFVVVGSDTNGCKNSDTVTVAYTSNKFFFIPNSFSPNGDGLNDVFIPRYLCNFLIKYFHVFNRYGQRVFSTNNPNVGWDGMQNGKRADIGTYFWYIEGKTATNETIIKKGDLTLIR
jgi:gliding motility-associated-like protein